ncbi:hypothetical protein NDU88_005301 [Pleurodeles waltl]|uniref:Uncharacterized protein n=1 Tax=Pleurodeles waltl TaxID=8319 RepID=A0AAV7UHP0_PLEWA|nr:hypothetical protein NDU88_005301 [Pleurodeles waltl]
MLRPLMPPAGVSSANQREMDVPPPPTTWGLPQSCPLGTFQFCPPQIPGAVVLACTRLTCFLCHIVNGSPLSRKWPGLHVTLLLGLGVKHKPKKHTLIQQSSRRVDKDM